MIQFKIKKCKFQIKIENTNKNNNHIEICKNLLKKDQSNPTLLMLTRSQRLQNRDFAISRTVIGKYKRKNNSTYGTDKKHVCEICDKVFNNAGHLTSDMRVHSGKRPFECTECTMKFTQIANLTAHMLTHSGAKPFTCPECSKTFSNFQYIYKHIMIDYF